MPSLTDFIQAPSGTPSAITDATILPQYRLNETPGALQADASIALARGRQDFANRTIPQMANNAAGQGNFGSTGANTQAQWAAQDFNRNQFDVSHMLSRNMANIAQQKVLATMAPMLGA